jgi:hypothetical protein
MVSQITRKKRLGVNPVKVHIRNRNLRPRGAQQRSDGPANAASSSGHQSAFSREVHL